MTTSRRILFSMLLALASGFVFGQSPPSWVMVWNDEFSGKGLPDSQKWSYDVGGNGWGNNDLAYDTEARPENAWVENGVLTITARREAFRGNSYTSARLNTKFKGDWTYGRIEVRAKISTDACQRPSIWLLPTYSEYGPWPRSGELDVMQYFGLRSGAIDSMVNTETYNIKNGTQKTHSLGVPQLDEFHVYEAEWNARQVVFRVDGQVTLTFANEGKGPATWPFDKPFYLLLGLAVSDDGGRTAGIAPFPARMTVDYVRVYQPVPARGPYEVRGIPSLNGTVSVTAQDTSPESGPAATLVAEPDDGYEFQRWEGDVWGTQNPMTITVNRPIQARAVFAPPGERVTNFQFENGFRGWVLQNLEGAESVWRMTAGRLDIETKRTDQAWKSQFMQYGIRLVQGQKYRFTVEASSDRPRSVAVGVARSDQPYTAYAQRTIALNLQPRTATFEFTMAENTDPNARVFFDLGDATGTISLAKVSVRELHASWVMVWNDEFDQKGLPDPQKWSYDVGGNGWGNRDLAYYTEARPENAWVDNGVLTISARREAYRGNAYTSARLHSRLKGDWTYGKIEVKAKIPTAKGQWPAIWMLPTYSEYGPWPLSGEIDIMEHVGITKGRVYSTINTQTYNHKNGTQQTGFLPVVAPETAFHVYECEWNAQEITFRIDGQEVLKFPNDGKGAATWPFDKPFYLLLNVAVGGDWGGTAGLDQSPFPSQMAVDYVRVYQLVEERRTFPVQVVPSLNGTVVTEPQSKVFAPDTKVTLRALASPGFEFLRWEGDLWGTDNPAAVTVNRPLGVHAVFAPRGERVLNPQFENGSQGWLLQNQAGAESTLRVAGGRLVIVTTKSADQAWKSQLMQYGVRLVKGQSYRFTVDVESDLPRSMAVGVARSDQPYTAYAQRTLSLIPRRQTLTFDFTMRDETDPNARVFFDLGDNVGMVTLSRVSVRQLP